MGKVGSTTIAHSLFMAGIYTLDIHTVHGRLVRDEEAARVAAEGGRLPHHVIRSRRAIPLLERAKNTIEVITVVREPIGRNLSAFFQNVSEADVEALSTDGLIEKFRTSYNQKLPLTWFDDEIRKSTGVDLLSAPFDKERGWSIKEEGRFRFLIYRLDGSKEKMQDALQDFLGERVHITANLNEGGQKFYAKAYSQFKKQIRFTEEEVEAFYESRYSKAFWTDAEIEQLKERWRAKEPVAQTP